MKVKEKILTVLTTSLVLTAILFPTTAHAALQANGSGASAKTILQWMSSIRQMESQGGTLGLTGSSSLQQQPGSDGKVANSNNLDIHMQKNTEYGAMVILSASSYGKSTPVHVTTDESLSTTTGNKSGVYMSLNNEWVAAGTLSGSNTANTDTYKNANLKYKNPYTDTKSSLPGDATLECSGWHNTGTSVTAEWIYNKPTAALLRARSGSIFSFCGSRVTAEYSKPYASRAVVVLGARNLKYLYTFSIYMCNLKAMTYKKIKN